MISSLDILYIVLSVCLVFLSLPLVLILWRTYKMMDRAERILAFFDRMVKYGEDLEKIPMAIIERFTSKK